MSHAVWEKCRPRTKCHMVFGKSLRRWTTGTFRVVLIFLRVDLDTLLGILRPYVVAFEFWRLLLNSIFRVSVIVLQGLKYIV